MKKTLLALTIATAVSPSAFAADKEKPKDADIEHIQIIGHSDKLRTESGSATLISEVELEAYEYDDIHRILSNVPGVNIREEDGYGLRPNIGFRGVTPERSKKITIMEDGVLIGPAPYSAPAAYYFPLTTRMTAVEVFKGPAAIKHGPQTVAGALNLVTRQVPSETIYGVDLATGSDAYFKGHGYYGTRKDDVGVLFEAVRLQADGFKELDNGGDTGFVKNDFLAKVNYEFASHGLAQKVELKVSYADENSDETYLGLTDDDFAANPYRRYAATEPANMDTAHNQVMFTHTARGDQFSTTTRVYRNNYERAWRKLNSLTNTTASLSEILAEPQQYEREYNVITGAQDSVVGGETSTFLVMGTNDREYYSQGIQFDSTYQFELAGLSHKASFGVRYHQDEIERKHFEENYKMEDGSAVYIDGTKYFTTTDIEQTDALSVYLEDTITIDALTLSAGLRGERMEMHYENLKDADEWQDKTTTIWLPGLSGFYKLSDDAGLLFGVYQGFTPTSPKQDADIKVEKSINYEFGGRYNDGATQFEIISFFNDYSNLKESCSQSNCGVLSDLDQEFNGGDVDVYGLESRIAQRLPISTQYDMPVSVTYTYTKSEFKDEIFSEFVQWGHVKPGDELPYLADHQATFNIGLDASEWQLNLAVKYVGEMKEAAGTSWDISDLPDGVTASSNGINVPLEGKTTDSSVVVDFSANYNLGDYGTVYGKIDNLLDEETIVSRRPYGARPGKPRQFVVGYKYSF